MALQGVKDTTERKKRPVAKGRNALDVLEKLKLGLLDGSVDGPMLARLKIVSEGLSEESDDSELAAVLGEIDLALRWNWRKPASASRSGGQPPGTLSHWPDIKSGPCAKRHWDIVGARAPVYKPAARGGLRF